MASTSAAASSSKVKSRAYAVRAAEATASSAEAFMKEWCIEEEDKVQQLQSARLLLSSADPSSHLEALVDYLQAVRRLTVRPAMTASEIALIPKDQGLLSALISICLDPLTYKLEGQADMVLESEDAMEVEGQATFYARRFSFSDKQKLSEFLDEASKRAPQYVYIIARIKAEMQILSEAVPVCLCYGGFTVATTPNGRCADDFRLRGDAGSFISVLLDLYKEAIQVVSFPALAFAVPDVIAARADLRTHLFESLVVDAFGLVCANTSSPGQYLQLAISPAVQSSLDILKGYEPDPKLFDRFASLNIQSAEPSTSNNAGATGGKKRKTKALAEKDKNAGGVAAETSKGKAKGKGKGKAKEEPADDAAEKPETPEKKKKRARAGPPLVPMSPTRSPKKAKKNA